MKFQAIQVFLLSGVLCAGTFLVAGETSHPEGCSEFDSRSDCVHLGELRGTVRVHGTFDSCTAGESINSLQLDESASGSVIRQIDLAQGGKVTVEVDGVGEARVFKDGALVLRMDGNVSSVQRGFDRGRYTFIGQAPLCGRVETDWTKAYTVRFDPHSAGEPNEHAQGTEDRSGEMVVSAQEDRKPTWRRILKWTVIVPMIAIAVFYLAIGLSHTA